MKICFIPIDNRPVCYTLAQDICAIDKNIELLLPPREMLGSLTINADYTNILEWLKNIPKSDAIILSLDTIAYGGLIPSRRSEESFKEDITKLRNYLYDLTGQESDYFRFPGGSNNEITTNHN